MTLRLYRPMFIVENKQCKIKPIFIVENKQ